MSVKAVYLTDQQRRVIAAALDICADIQQGLDEDATELRELRALMLEGVPR